MIQVTIHTDEGDAFSPSPGPEAARILSTLVGEVVKITSSTDSYRRDLYDINGVQCGSVRFVKDEDKPTCDFARCGCHTIRGVPIPPPVTTEQHVHLAMIEEFGEEYKGIASMVLKNDLVKDVIAIMREDLDAFDPTNVVPVHENARKAAHLLYSRIGGPGNLSSYSLVLGPSPRRGRARRAKDAK